ncbi:hypothetical protein AA650_12955 [Anabaena sp. WA102]|uniref:DUF1868 domain-containing protein n=3 Tax=Cyanophyceae TaxID=3028117 RepID=A0ACC7S2R4_DOLFA|nr:hypothetical protein AA650_12955 [Anabaena sp. WA102]MBO1067275.1 DUF1868 domain-containing protein [Anabaena sp. 54]MTJ42813.1 DUF1868 domain-containing protein [Dolichospermum flos-aquae UHCC 0037]OBQ16078.1 MAG: hypothetical protein AN486_20550 [Anabaena sp. AL93]
MTLPEAYKTQIQHIQESSKFRVHAGVREATPFPGYTLITPPAQEDANNAAFYSKIQAYQQQLLKLPIASDLIVPVPPASFHVTVADLIWDSAFHHACAKNPQFAEDLNSQLAERFQEYQKLMTKGSPISWQMLGLIVMPRAVGMCLVPKDKRSYEEIIQFRRIIYQNRTLMGLGIEQHYHFTAHVTLGYFGEIPPELNRVNLTTMFCEFNQSLPLDTPDFLIDQVELRKFDNMTHYYRQPDWPSVNFKSMGV